MPQTQEKPFIKNIPSPAGTLTIAGGDLWEVDEPNAAVYANQMVKGGDMMVDLTEFMIAEGEKTGEAKAKRFLDAILAPFKDAGFTTERNVIEEADGWRGYARVDYPAEMSRQDLFEQMQELAERGIKAYEHSKANGLKKGKTPASNAGAYFDKFSDVLKEELGENGMAVFEGKHPQFLRKLVQAATRVDQQSKEKHR